MEFLLTFAIVYGHIAAIVAVVWVMVSVSLDPTKLVSKVIDAVKMGAGWPYFVVWEGIVLQLLSRNKSELGSVSHQSGRFRTGI